MLGWSGFAPSLRTSWVPYAYEELTVADTVIGLTPGRLAERCACASVRFYGGTMNATTVAGMVPTASFGVPYGELSWEVFVASEARRLRLIRAGSDNGLVRVTYYRLDGGGT